MHHRDGNRANSSPGNLEVLCLGCHKEEFGHERLKFTPGYDSFFALATNSDLIGVTKEGIDATLLQHVSPIKWDNVILYGQYVLDRARVR